MKDRRNSNNYSAVNQNAHAIHRFNVSFQFTKLKSHTAQKESSVLKAEVIAGNSIFFLKYYLNKATQTNCIGLLVFLWVPKPEWAALIYTMFVAYVLYVP